MILKDCQALAYGSPFGANVFRRAVVHDGARVCGHCGARGVKIKSGYRLWHYAALYLGGYTALDGAVYCGVNCWRVAGCK